MREGDFARKNYQRAHTWEFDGGVVVKAAASPHVVPVAMTAEDAVDPEEALVASASSCHMLTFLFLAANDGYVVESYDDAAEGFLTKEGGGQWVSEIVLHPAIVFGGERRPDAAALERLHHLAHEQCFIARSLKTKITVGSPTA